MPRLLLILGLLLLSSCAVSSDRQGADDLIFTSQFSAELQAALEASFKIQNADAISASLYISDRCYWTGTAGTVAPTSNKSIYPDTLFNFGSITKTFVAAIVLQLAEENRLDLDDPLGKWLDEYPHIDPDISIRLLLNHGSGIYNFTENENFWSDVEDYPDRLWSPEDILKYIKAPVPTGFSPAHYSNTNYILLGLIIESATGNSLEEELHNRITTALMLDGTHLAKGRFDPNRWANLEALYQSKFSSVWAAGAIVSTSKNIAKWSQNLYSGNFLKPDSLESMLVTEARGRPRGRRISAGFGVVKLRVEHELAWGHTGWLPPFTAKAMYLPKYGFSVAYASSGGNISKLSVPGDLLVSKYLDNLPDDISMCFDP